MAIKHIHQTCNVILLYHCQGPIGLLCSLMPAQVWTLERTFTCKTISKRATSEEGNEQRNNADRSRITRLPFHSLSSIATAIICTPRWDIGPL